MGFVTRVCLYVTAQVLTVIEESGNEEMGTLLEFEGYFRVWSVVTFRQRHRSRKMTLFHPLKRVEQTWTLRFSSIA